MKRLFLLFLGWLAPALYSAASPIETDYAIFLFDNGEKNMVAAMLKVAEKEDRTTLEELDFRIIFMGASIDAMDKEPFSHYPDKLIHYKQLGVEETIDNQWKRDRKLTTSSLNALVGNLHIRKKLWVGVSCSVFEQLVHHYQKEGKIEVLALRDNPSPEGDTDYFKIADQVQKAAHVIAVPSKIAASKLDPAKKAIVVGHPSIEEFQELVQQLDKNAILTCLGLNPDLPIVVYSGSYGDFYQKCFEQFLEMMPQEGMQVLVLPHPRYKGSIEKLVCKNGKNNFAKFAIIGEWEEELSKKVKTIEALAIADFVVVADATSTVVFQANALKKKVFYINPAFSKVSEELCARKLIYKISSREEFLKQLDKENSSLSAGKDVFELLGIPHQGAQLLWQEWIRSQ